MRGPSSTSRASEPYRLSDLDRLLGTIRGNRARCGSTSIGKTVGGRDLEIVRIGDPAAPYRVFVRARAHPWESGSNWVAQGLIQRLLTRRRGGEEIPAASTASTCCRWRTRTASRAAARGSISTGRISIATGTRRRIPSSSPENAALEKWLEGEIAAGRKPHLALELHNDGNGRLHISRPPVPQLDRHLARMAILEELLRKHTWFTEGSTDAAFRNSGTLGDGWLERYGIDAAVHEFNCNWIEGLKDYPSAAHWMTYGEKLAEVFHDYFDRVKP